MYDPDKDKDRDSKRGPDVDTCTPTTCPMRHHSTAHEPMKPVHNPGPQQGQRRGY